MRKLLICICLLAPVAAWSQENPLSAFAKRIYGFQKDILLRSADKMPEENYSFKPADSVRSYGQIVGHLADAQYLFCSAAPGAPHGRASPIVPGSAFRRVPGPRPAR